MQQIHGRQRRSVSPRKPTSPSLIPAPPLSDSPSSATSHLSPLLGLQLSLGPDQQPAAGPSDMAGMDVEMGSVSDDGGDEVESEDKDKDKEQPAEDLADGSALQGADGGEDGGGGGIDEDVVLEALQNLLQSTAIDFGPDPERFTPSASPQTSGDTSNTTITLEPRTIPAQSAADLLPQWPYLLPQYLLDPPHSGNRPNPYAQPVLPPIGPTSFRSRSLLVLAHTLTGMFNVPRRATGLVLRAGSAIIRMSERRMYKRFVTWYRYQHPAESADVLDDLDSALNPVFDEDAAPRTLSTALRHLQVDEGLSVHPQCKNDECSEVFYSITRREYFSLLPTLCPACHLPMRDASGQVQVLYYPRRSLWAELETVLRIPGVEQALENRESRRAISKAEEEKVSRQSAGGWTTIYRHHDDGSFWAPGRKVETAPAGSLTVTVNLGIDWANPSSRRSAAADPMGPISLQIADLPAELRSSFSCTMLMGITPGPKQPKAANLWKLLLPLVLEIRAAEAHGLWIQTPSHPQGRLIRVTLGCLRADRPAAVELTGGPHFSARRTPCLRCEIRSDEISLLADSRPRDSHAHNVATIEQVSSIPRAVQKDKEAWDESERLRIGSSRKKIKAYPAARRKAAVEAATTAKGHLSALAFIPGFPKFDCATFDPMHSLLEGSCQTYFYKVLILGDHGLAPVTDAGSGRETGTVLRSLRRTHR